MDGTRRGLRALFEWAVAAGCILLVSGIASTALHKIRDVEAIMPVIAGAQPAPEPPGALPSGAVFVPILLLSTGEELRVGQHTSELTSRVSDTWQMGPETVERAGGGYRTVRQYHDGATRFVVVVQGERVVAIYRK